MFGDKQLSRIFLVQMKAWQRWAFARSQHFFLLSCLIGLSIMSPVIYADSLTNQTRGLFNSCTQGQQAFVKNYSGLEDAYRDAIRAKSGKKNFKTSQRRGTEFADLGRFMFLHLVPKSWLVKSIYGSCWLHWSDAINGLKSGASTALGKSAIDWNTCIVAGYRENIPPFARQMQTCLKALTSQK